MAQTYEALLLPAYGFLTANLPSLQSSTLLTTTTASVTYTVSNQFNRVLCVWRCMSSAAVTSTNFEVQFNGDTGSHYIWQDIQGSNSSSNANSSGGATTFMAQGNVPGTSATTNYFASGSFIIDGCTQGATFMTAQGTSCCFISATSSIAGTYAGQYLVSAQLSSVTLFPASGSFVSGSQFTFYGLG